MDARRIFIGTIIWSLGLFLPVLQHAMLINAAVQEESHTYSYHYMVKYFFHLPWIVWIYFAAMLIVGAILVVTGFKSKPARD